MNKYEPLLKKGNKKENIQKSKLKKSEVRRILTIRIAANIAEHDIKSRLIIIQKLIMIRQFYVM